MELGDLLTELRENILHDRSAQIAGPSDQLWTDATLVRYINEAQRRFARLSLVIRDSVSEATKVNLVAGRSTYKLHPAVLAVISARFPGDVTDLLRGSHSVFNPQPPGWDTSTLIRDGLAPGKPRAFTTDEAAAEDYEGSSGVVTLKLYPTPSEDFTGCLRLRVARLPITKFVLTDLRAIPEIPEDHHLEMLDWAAYLALRIVDQDAGNPTRAAEFRASFEDHVKEARRTAMRKMFAPMGWGMGRNGFSWEH